FPAGPKSVSVDESGNGFWISAAGGFTGLPFALAPDPGPGGLPSTLTYQLPPGVAGVPGDVFLQDAGVTLDVIRFNGNGTLIFYSDNVDGFEAIGDTPSPPSSFYPNPVVGNEFGPEGGVEGADYTPLPNQPGFDPTGQVVTYHLISDVPEPASLALLL